MEWKVFNGFSKKKKKKKHEEITQVSSRLSFYYRLSVVEKYVEKCLKR